MTPNVVLEILDWAKTKEDLLELRYENKASNPPISIHFAMASVPAGQSLSDGKSILYLKAPTIGKVSYLAQKVSVGSAVGAQQVLGLVEGEKEKVEILSPSAGKLQEVLIPAGQWVGFGEPLLLIELN